jgi:hypothetical protein
MFSWACGGSGKGHRWEVRAVVAELAQARVSRLRHAALLYAGPGEFAVGVWAAPRFPDS